MYDANKVFRRQRLYIIHYDYDTYILLKRTAICDSWTTSKKPPRWWVALSGLQSSHQDSYYWPTSTFELF